jgi:hypothetical protein
VCDPDAVAPQKSLWNIGIPTSGIGTNLDDLSALPAVHDDGLCHLLAGFWLAGGLLLAPFALGFLISNSTYRFRPRGAPSREVDAAEIWISCGLVSRVFLTEASILARKQSGDVHESKPSSL